MTDAEKLVERSNTHAGEPVTWERLRDAHSAMLGTKAWEPTQVDPPQSGHRVYRQGPNERCYMCAALELIDKAEARIEKLEAALAQIAALRLRGMETEAQRIARQALASKPDAAMTKDER